MGHMTKGGRLDRRGSILKGCLVVLVLLLIAGGIATWYVWTNWRGWAADGSIALVEQSLEESSLPEEQKTAIMAEVETLASDFKEGRVTLTQMTQVIESLAKSPIIPATAVGVMYQEYVEQSEFTTDEREEARLAMQRLARGVYEETIPVESLGEITDPIAAHQGEVAAMSFDIEEKRYTLAKPEYVSTEELREFVSRARTTADEAGVPDEPYEIDVAAEVRKAIREGLGKAPEEGAGDGNDGAADGSGEQDGANDGSEGAEPGGS